MPAAARRSLGTNLFTAALGTASACTSTCSPVPSYWLAAALWRRLSQGDRTAFIAHRRPPRCRHISTAAARVLGMCTSTLMPAYFAACPVWRILMCRMDVAPAWFRAVSWGAPDRMAATTYVCGRIHLCSSLILPPHPNPYSRFARFSFGCPHVFPGVLQIPAVVHPLAREPRTSVPK